MPTVKGMDPRTAIAPVPTVRRAQAKRVHMLDADRKATWPMTFCGQSIFAGVKGTAYNAAQITCNDCLVAAISRGGAK